MTPLDFIHLTLKRPVTVTKELVLAAWAAESLNGTYIIGPGGAIVPVQESLADVRRKVWGTTEGKPATVPGRARSK